MSGIESNKYPGGIATPQEQQLLAVQACAYDVAITDIVVGMSQGRSPSFLSIARPDLLMGFAQAFTSADMVDDPGYESQVTYKTMLFDAYKHRADEGDPASIQALSKFSTSLGQLSAAMELVLEHREEITAWQEDRAYLQYLGTFDPQHIGHRIGIQSGLETAGDQSSTLVHTMGQHPRKSNFREPYEKRYIDAEERFYKTPLLDNTRVTQVDVPGGVGLATQGLEQMKLLADVCGDTELRWLIGSDKLILDATAIRENRSPDKAVTRFSEPRMHAYVIHRQSDERACLENDIDYINDRFGTPVTLVDELPYDCAPASSSRIKELRTEGKHDEADHMELYELLS